MAAPSPKGSKAFRLRTELSRERDALRHLQSWVELYRPPFINRNPFPDDDSMSMPRPATCHDTTLAALAQLGALRIGVRRCFVSILSSKREYILVESTRTMQLQSDAVEDTLDEIWLGACSLAREDGLNGDAADTWRKARQVRETPPNPSEHYYTEGSSPHYYVVSDLLRHATASQCAFVKRARSPRFFFSLPLRDHEGSVIGALSFLHDVPRIGISATELLFCEDLSDTVSQHLHSSIVRLQRQRSERLIQALGTFNNHGSSLREWALHEDNRSVNTNRGGRYHDKTVNIEEQNARLDQEFGVLKNNRSGSDRSSDAELGASRDARRSHNAFVSPSTEGNDKAAANRVESGVKDADFGLSSKKNVLPQGVVKSAASSPTSTRGGRRRDKTEAFNYAQEVTLAYGRASNLLRESLSATGVAFVDASAASTGRLSAARPPMNRRFTNQSHRADLTPTSSDSANVATSDTDTHSDDTAARASRTCKGIAFSTHTQSTIGGSRSFPFQMPERELAKLVKAYPRRGRVFNFEENGNPYSGSEDNGASASGLSSDATSGTPTPRVVNRHGRNGRMLRKVLGEARSIAFYPIWDDDGDRWRSCVFVWTTTTARFFDPVEDLTYFSAFAHSLRSELAHLDALAADVAKSRFISSVSHELRSPLHGILAGIEMIQDSKMTPFQAEMATSVSLAGRTLLDTVNHILDYSKISQLSHAQKRAQKREDASRHKSGSASEGGSTDGEGYLVDVDLSRFTEEVVESVVSAHRFEKSAQATTSNKRQPPAVSVVLDIEKRNDWTTPIIPGAFTRIITNILGNALKYTPKGLVSVRLFAHAPKPPHSRSSTVFLEVEDTGIGMEQNFIDHDVFRPFKQADAHSVGTGLGLSIVHEVARREFDAIIDVRSAVGCGTTFTVKFEAHLKAADPMDTTILPGDSEDLGSLTANALAESVFKTASQWLESKTTLSDAIPSNPRPSVCVITEADLVALDQAHPDQVGALLNRLAAVGSHVLIIGRFASSNRPKFRFGDFPIEPVYMLQPVGPRKLLRTIATTLNQSQGFPMPSTNSEASSRVARGESQGTGFDGEEETGASYYQLPVRPENKRSSSSQPLATPTSFFDDMASDSGRAGSSENVQTGTHGVTDSRGVESIDVDEASHGTTVLLTEDNEINMRLLIALMKKQNLPYKCASNGAEALEIYRTTPLEFFLVIMDMSMPVMNGKLIHTSSGKVSLISHLAGFEATAQIREFERKNKVRGTCIAALTGVTNSEARSSAFQSGVDKYLTKPIRMKDLTALVDEIRMQQGEDG